MHLIHPAKLKKSKTSCKVCIQAPHNAVEQVWLKKLSKSMTEMSSGKICIQGNARFRFLDGVVRFQREAHIAYKRKATRRNIRDAAHGFPWGIDCMLPNGYKELTCSSLTQSIQHNRISSHTSFQLHPTKGTPFTVNSEWPWRSLMTHNDDRSKFFSELPKNAIDTSSIYMPSKASDMRLLVVDGPV
jgi:hypothetical protein